MYTIFSFRWFCCISTLAGAGAAALPPYSLTVASAFLTTCKYLLAFSDMDPCELLSLTPLILLLLLNAANVVAANVVADEDCSADDLLEDHSLLDSQTMDMDGVTHAVLQHWQLWNSLTVLDDDLGNWVKPRSTTWFSRFLLEEYGDDRWIQMFRMTKRSVLSLAQVLKVSIQKDTNCRLAIPVLVRLACTLFKLSHGVSLLVCSEMFAVEHNTVSIMFRDIVHALNVALRSEISWPTGNALHSTAAEFYQLCGLPGVLGAIDSTQIPISKPEHDSADYYHRKSGSYTMNCQAVVDSSKRFLDIYVGMPGSKNNSRMLHMSTLYQKAQRNALWDAGASFNGFSPYLLGNTGYPLLPWLMVRHRQHGQLSMADALFNEKMCRGRGVVENAFALLKQSFKELDMQSNLSVSLLPDVVICCTLLHNLLLRQGHEDVVLSTETGVQGVEADRPGAVGPQEPLDEQTVFAGGSQKRRQLGLFLAAQHVVPI